MREFVTALGQVSLRQRQALLLSTLGGHSYKQIASRAGVAVGTVKSRVSRGRVALERLLAGKALADYRASKLWGGTQSSD